MATQETGYPVAKTLDRGREIVHIVGGLVKTLESSPNTGAGLVAAGKIQEVGQNYALAQLAYCSALTVDASCSEATVRKAIVNIKTGNFAKALSIIKDFTDKNPDYKFSDISGNPLSALTILGDAYRNTGNLPAAKNAYTRALQLISEDSHSAAHLARIHLADNDVEKAASLSDQFLGDDEMSSLQSTTRLLSNDPNRLPAIGGLVSSFASMHQNVK